MAVDWTGYKLAPDFSGLAQGLAQYGANKRQQAQFDAELDYKNRALAADTEAKRQAMLGGVNKFAPSVSYGQNLYKGNDNGIYRPVYMTDRNTMETTTSYINEITGQPVDPNDVPSLGLKMTTSGLTVGAEQVEQISAEERARQAEKTRAEEDRLKNAQTIKLATEPSMQKSIEAAKVEGKALGEDAYVFGDIDARMPILYDTVARLGKLSKTATYTTFGKGKDEVIKQLGFTTTEGADARGNYIAIIDNEVLPLLRSTFGAAFTVEEGNRLRNTLGDPDSSPSQKQATLDAFIKSKENQVRMLGSKLGFNPKNIAPTAPTQGAQPNQAQLDYEAKKKALGL